VISRSKHSLSKSSGHAFTIQKKTSAMVLSVALSWNFERLFSGEAHQDVEVRQKRQEAPE